MIEITILLQKESDYSCFFIDVACDHFCADNRKVTIWGKDRCLEIRRKEGLCDFFVSSSMPNAQGDGLYIKSRQNWQEVAEAFELLPDESGNFHGKTASKLPWIA